MSWSVGAEVVVGAMLPLLWLTAVCFLQWFVWSDDQRQFVAWRVSAAVRGEPIAPYVDEDNSESFVVEECEKENNKMGARTRFVMAVGTMTDIESAVNKLLDDGARVLQLTVVPKTAAATVQPLDSTAQGDGGSLDKYLLSIMYIPGWYVARQRRGESLTAPVAATVEAAEQPTVPTTADHEAYLDS